MSNLIGKWLWLEELLKFDIIYIICDIWCQRVIKMPSRLMEKWAIWEWHMIHAF